MKNTKTMLAAGALCVLAAMQDARATLYDSRAAWEGVVSGVTEVPDTWLTGGAPFAEGEELSLISGPTLSFNVDLFGAQVPDDWMTWSGGNTPKVLYTFGSAVMGTFSSAVSFFGLEMQPNAFGLFAMTLATGETITRSVEGDSGAAFFGWAGEAVTSFSMSVDAETSLFAFGRMVEGSAPTPNPVPDGGSTGLLSALAIAGMLGFSKRRTKA